MSSSTAQTTPQPPAARMPAIAGVMTRYRMLLSFLLFGGLIAHDLLNNVRPHDLLDPSDWHTSLGIVLALSGLALRSWSAGTLTKWRQLTTCGPYQFVRNPLYVGSFLMMFGFCLLIGDAINLLFVAGPVLLLYAFKVRQEEVSLGERYQEAWVEYARRTPRFFPWRLSLPRGGQWSLAQWWKNREYEAFAATLGGLVAMQLWHLGLVHL